MGHPRQAQELYEERFTVAYDHAQVSGGNLITCVAFASLADTDFMTIADGHDPAVVYEFDTAGDGVTAGRVQVDVSGDTTAADVAATLHAAIVANQPALAAVDNADGTVSLPSGDRVLTVTENVANAGFTVAAITADSEVKLWAPKTGRDFRIDRVWYNNPTGLAAHASNYFDIQVKAAGGNVAFNWSTETGEEGALVADTPVEFSAAADDEDQVIAGGTVLSVNFDETGTATLPAGRLVVEGRYVS